MSHANALAEQIPPWQFGDPFLPPNVMTVGVVERCETDFPAAANAVPNVVPLRDKRTTRIGSRPGRMRFRYRLGTAPLFRNMNGLILREGEQKKNVRVINFLVLFPMLVSFCPSSFCHPGAEQAYRLPTPYSKCQAAARPFWRRRSSSFCNRLRWDSPLRAASTRRLTLFRIARW